MNLKKLIKIVASKAETIEELEISGENWKRMFIENGFLKEGDKVLDYGAGLGRVSIPFSKIAKVIAVDGNREMVEYLKSKGIDASLKLDKELDFDFIVCAYVLQHIHFPEAQELAKVFSEISPRLYFTLPIIDDGVDDSYIHYSKSFYVPIEESSNVSRSMYLKELPILFEKSKYNPKTIRRITFNLFEIKL